MSRKHAELEREFLADLESRTGRSLEAWLAAIDAAGLTSRNAIIDWLRPQGLTFARASWLERIHHNGGRPIYGDVPERLPLPATPPATFVTPPPPAPPPPAAPPAAKPAPTPPAPAPAVARPAPPISASTTVSLDDLLARGKGLRPLASMLLNELTRALPGIAHVPSGDLVSLRRPNELAVLLIGPRELRLGLDLGSYPFNALVSRSKIPGTSAQITHMVVLNDARQINADLMQLVSAADANVNSGA